MGELQTVGLSNLILLAFFHRTESKPRNLREPVQASLVKINPPIVSMVEINLKFRNTVQKNSGPMKKNFHA